MKHRSWIISGGFCFLAAAFVTVASIRAVDSQKSLFSQIQLFSAVLDRIKQDYVEETDSEVLLDNAIKGMVSTLDPHTTFLAAKQFERFSQNYEGYSGIGIEFDIIRNKITIMSVFENGPSDQAGLITGDRIVDIDGKTAVGLKRDEVPLKLMGPKGSSVEVTVERNGWTRPKSYTLMRDEIHVKSVPYAFMLNNGIGYIGIIRFSSTTGKELEDALIKLENQGMKQLILDLRFNTGGYLESAVDVVDRFLPRGKMIVYTKGRIQGSYREFFSTERSTHPIKPIIVLINRISASASEIVAGALQDWDRALILGETSFGKGLVQSQYRFPDGSALLMTTARYYTPSGRLIQRPYSDKSSEEYYSEVADDSLREQKDQDRSRPMFKTKILNREVYGGGGITPDVALTAKQDTFSAKIRELVFSPERPLYIFAEDYLKLHPEIKKDFNDFLWNFRLDPTAQQRFLTTIRNLGLSLSSAEFTGNREDILFLVKQTLADMIWGDEARQKIALLRDRQLQESLSYFIKAEGLLSQAYSSQTKQG